jgi:hypothetical protein
MAETAAGLAGFFSLENRFEATLNPIINHFMSIDHI